MNLISENLAKARQARGFSQDEMAKALDLSRPTYASVESGKRDLTISEAEKAVAKLRITMEQLLGEPSEVIFDMNAAYDKYKQIILNSLYFGADDHDRKITKTKLAKLVYLSDFIWYYKHLKPMSCMSYRRLARGPVADAYFRAIDELLENDVITMEAKGTAFMLSMVEDGAPNSRLNSEEKSLIKNVAEAWKGKLTQEVVEFTHQQLPWQICRDGEIIPYSLITQEDPEKVYGPVKL